MNNISYLIILIYIIGGIMLLVCTHKDATTAALDQVESD